MKIRIYDVENLPFGCYVSVRTLNNDIKRGVAIDAGIALEDGQIINFANIALLEVYLGWQ